MTLKDAETYCTKQVEDLRQMSTAGTPWVFLCASAFIDYLSKLADGKNNGAAGFKQFVEDYMPHSYRNFAYKSGTTDLPDQLYHVLRCGIVHSFSLLPDTQATHKGGRDRSIVLSHDAPHLSQYASQGAPDACCLNANEFIKDLDCAVKKLFKDAATNAKIAGNITTWVTQHPPISGNI